MITIAETDNKRACYSLRHKVFVDEQGYSAEGEVDDLDATSLHLMAVDGETPVATARIYLSDGVAKIGRVCVLQSHRGTGLGADLIREAVDLADRKGAVRAVLGAQTQAVGFYEKLGFAPFGDIYSDEGEPHQMMERTL